MNAERMTEAEFRSVLKQHLASFGQKYADELSEYDTLWNWRFYQKDPSAYIHLEKYRGPK